MKSKLISRILAMTAGVVITLGFSPATTIAQGTAFTYQGRLNDGASAANGTYDVRFAIYDAQTLGIQRGAILTNTATVVSNGLFTVTLDFGNQFPGANRWLELGVRTNGGGAFSTLAPRQPLTPTPYAVFANLANTARSIPGVLVNTNLSATAIGLANTVSGVASTALGYNNSASGPASVAMGEENSALGPRSIAMGYQTSANGVGALAGGYGSVANGEGATALGESSATGNFATALGASSASGISSMAAGYAASAIHNGSFVWADFSTPTAFASTGTNQFLIRAKGGVGINNNNPNGAALAVNGDVTVEGVVYANGISAASVTTPQLITPEVVTPKISTAGNVPLECYVNGQRGLRLEPTATLDAVNVIGGSAQNSVGAGLEGATIAGGGTALYPNTISASYATIGGGTLNTVAGGWTTIAGGRDNNVTGNYSAISGGEANRIRNSTQATIGGGNFNTAGANYATVPGGFENYAVGQYSFAAGNSAQALHDGAFVWADSLGGGFSSTANDQFCIQAHGGVQLDPLTSQFFGSQTRQMLNLYGTSYGLGVQSDTLYFRCANQDGNSGFIWYKGGVHNDNYVGSGGAGGGTEMMHLVAGGLYVNGTIVLTSDRNAKENFAPVQAREVLDKVVALPLSSWNYKADTATRHVGPMAQDFYAAFNVGPDDKHIATVDADGVALAAIQGLNQKLEATLKQKETEIAELKSRLERLEQFLTPSTK